MAGAAGAVGAISWFSGNDDAAPDPAAIRAAAPGDPAPSPARLSRLLAAGNIVVEHGSQADGAALRRVAEQVAGPDSHELQAAGQAILVRARPGSEGIVAYAHRRRLRVGDPMNPALQEFAEYWLGRGAP